MVGLATLAALASLATLARFPALANWATLASLATLWSIRLLFVLSRDSLVPFFELASVFRASLATFGQVGRLPTLLMPLMLASPESLGFV